MGHSKFYNTWTPSACCQARWDCSYSLVPTSAGGTPLHSSLPPFFSCLVPVTGVCYNSLFWISTLNTDLTWPDLLPLHGLLFFISSNIIYMHHPKDRMVYTLSSVTPVVEHRLGWEIDQWFHHEGLIRQREDSQYNISTEGTLPPGSWTTIKMIKIKTSVWLWYLIWFLVPASVPQMV